MQVDPQGASPFRTARNSMFENIFVRSGHSTSYLAGGDEPFRACRPSERRTFRTVARDTVISRLIHLIERPSRKWARRTFPILSTPSIPRLALPKPRLHRPVFHLSRARSALFLRDLYGNLAGRARH